MFLPELINETEQNRVRLTDTLIAFVKTDTILFAFNKECADSYLPFVTAVNNILNTAFVLTSGLDVAAVNFEQDDNLRAYSDNLPIKKFALLYLVATKVRSVLLSVLFLEKKIDVSELFNIAFYEKLYQQRKWGKTEEAEVFDKQIIEELVKLEQLRDEKSLLED